MMTLSKIIEQHRATFDLWQNEPIFKNTRVNPEYAVFR